MNYRSIWMSEVGTLFRILAVTTILVSQIALADPPRIGIYTGTFSPPHSGHVAAAEFLKKRYNLDFVYVVPNVTSDHKADVLSYEYRKQMSKIAFDKPGMVVADPEMERAFKEADVTGVQLAIQRKHPGALIYQAMGDDSYPRFLAADRQPIKNHHIVVLTRDGKVADVDTKDPRLGDVTVHTPQFDGAINVSSSKIRSALKEGNPPPNVDPEVHSYIRKLNLFVESCDKLLAEAR